MTFSGPFSFIVWSRNGPSQEFHQMKLGNRTRFQHDGHISWLRIGIGNHLQNIARIANAVPVTLYSRVTMNVEIVVLNCQQWDQCFKCHKSLGLLFEGVLSMSMSMSICTGHVSHSDQMFLSLSLYLFFFWAPHKLSAQPPFFFSPSSTYTSKWVWVWGHWICQYKNNYTLIWFAIWKIPCPRVWSRHTV